MEFREYQIVFRLQMRGSGLLSFYDDDGCVIRRNGAIVHDDRAAHRLTRHGIWVEDGDLLEVAHWQLGGEWKWGAFLESEPVTLERVVSTFLPYLPDVEARLTRPEGPALKVFTDLARPARTVLAVYGLILNGFAPSRVLLYGCHQWNEEAWRLAETLFRFARVVPTEEVDAALAAAGVTGSLSGHGSGRW